MDFLTEVNNFLKETKEYNEKHSVALSTSSRADFFACKAEYMNKFLDKIEDELLRLEKENEELRNSILVREKSSTIEDSESNSIPLSSEDAAFYFPLGRD